MPQGHGTTMGYHGYSWHSPRIVRNKVSVAMSHPNVQGRLKLLWRKMTDPETNLALWDFKSRVVETAMQMFQDDPLKAIQTTNRECDVTHLEFLSDCFSFVTTGKRQMRIQNWNTILGHSDTTSGPNDEDQGDPMGYMSKISKLRSMKTSTLVEQWVSKPNGYEDLVYTLKILYAVEAF